jgi:very-short-patch-repair endonuclease
MPKKSTKEEFIKISNKSHNNFYNYDNVIYVNNITKVKIICPIHGEFKQIPKDHKKGRGCWKCGKLKSIKTRSHTLEKFIEMSNKKHQNKYDYSLIKSYKNNRTKVQIICKEHGVFLQTPDHHLNGVNGCKKCKIKSLGEEKIKKILIENNIDFLEQYKFENQPKNIKNCCYDFYIPKKNLIIEYHGIQHFKLNTFFHNHIFDLLDQIKRDYDKKKYCIENSINFLEIHYNFSKKKINKILNNI